MAPRFKKMMFQTYKSEKGADALICFPFSEVDYILPLRDKLAEIIIKSKNLNLHKVLDSHYDIDSHFKFYLKEDEKTVKDFHQKEWPGIVSWVFKTKKYLTYKAEEEKIKKLIRIEAETSHDFPCIIINSSILTEEEIFQFIEQAANKLNLKVPKNSNLGPIKDIVTSNHSFNY